MKMEYASTGSLHINMVAGVILVLMSCAKNVNTTTSVNNIVPQDVTSIVPNDVTSDEILDVNIAIFAPFNESCDYNSAKVMQVVRMAIDTVTRRQLCNGVRINPRPFDSMWPENRHVEITAYRLIFNSTKQTTHAVIGPVASVPLSNIVYAASHENRAVITPGGYSVNFGLNKTVYRDFSNIVRIGPTVNHFFNWFRQLLVDRFKFRKLKLLSDKHGSNDLCLWLHSGFDYLLNLYKNDLTDEPFEFDTHLLTKKYDPEDILRNEVGTQFSGETVNVYN